MVVGKRVAKCFYNAISQLSYDSGTAEASRTANTRLAVEALTLIDEKLK